MTLALFHTVFNLLGVAIMWPVSRHLERWLAGRFVTMEENESRPQFLDRNSREIPTLAANAVLLELRRVADIALDIARSGFADAAPPVERLERRNEVLRPLNEAIVTYLQGINAANKSEAAAEAMTHPIRALWHFSEIAGLGVSAARRQRELHQFPTVLHNRIAEYAALVAGEIDLARRAYADPSVAPPDEATTEPAYQRAKHGILLAASSGVIDAARAETALEILFEMKSAIHLLARAGRRMAAIASFVESDQTGSQAA